MRKLALICCILVAIMHPAVFTAGSQIQTFSQIQVPAAAPEDQIPTEFQQAMERVGKAAGAAGVLVVSLSSGEVVCQSRAKDTLVPASLMKLLTSYAAMKKLGPSFRFTTKVLAVEAPVEGVISGDIWIKGSGDPFFVSEKALQLAQTIKESGIRQIRGSIFVDDSFFDLPSERICLDSDCAGAYNPVVSAAAIEYNTLTVRITTPAKGGGAFGVDPGLAAGYVRVSGKPGSGRGALH